MNSTIGAMGGIQLGILLGFSFVVPYLLSFLLAAVVLLRRGPSRALAGWTLLAHLTPAIVMALLAGLFFLEMAVLGPLPDPFISGVVFAGWALGPIMSLILIVSLIHRRVRPASRTVAPMLVGGFVFLLAACGQSEEAPVEAPAETAAETAPAEVDAPPSDAALTAASAEDLTLARLRGACRATIAVVHEQEVPAVRIDGVEGTTVNLSWPAPVDGGRRTAQCRIEGPQVTWRPTGLPDVAQMRWMNTSADPIITYAIDGEQVVVTQLFQDGTTATAKAPVAVGQEGA